MVWVGFSFLLVSFFHSYFLTIKTTVARMPNLFIYYALCIVPGGLTQALTHASLVLNHQAILPVLVQSFKKYRIVFLVYEAFGTIPSTISKIKITKSNHAAPIL